MKIFTTEDVRAIDRRTMEVDGIPSRELIKRAARGMADEIMARWRPTRPFVFFAGPGNNGADALAIATIMMGQGYRPTVYRSISAARCCRSTAGRSAMRCFRRAVRSIS